MNPDTLVKQTSTATGRGPGRLVSARLPRWCLPADWPCDPTGAPALADLRMAGGRLTEIRPGGGSGEPSGPDVIGSGDSWDLAGAPVLPGLVDAHTHLDCAFTRHRIPQLRPGLLGGIAGKAADRTNWSAEDLHARASKALQWAWESGTVLLRSHVDWPLAGQPPLAWSVFAELAQEWHGRVELQRVALVRPTLHASSETARALARQVAAGGPGACLGGFIHTSNWNPPAIRHLVEAAIGNGLDLDLHVDEETDPAAQGLAFVAELLHDLNFGGRVLCGHNCALASQSPARALATLDAVARVPITLVALPQNNLLLQDAETGRTPRVRGLTLLHEARERGIPVLMASDSVQDPFCPVGSFDPVEALMAGVLAGQLMRPFDDWSQAICRADWLQPSPGSGLLQPGARCDLLLFGATDSQGWPSRATPRVVLRDGIPLQAPPLPTWQLAAAGPTRSC